MTDQRTSMSTSMTRSPVQVAALAVSAAFLLVGVLGFIPGVTTHYDQLDVYGHHSHAQLLGLFQVSVLHNLVHVVFWVVGFALATRMGGARSFLLGGGVVYLVLVVYGLVVDYASKANFVPLDDADNWLHLVLGAAMIALSFLPSTLARTTHRTL